MFTEKIIKFNHGPDSRIYFTSDTHFGHQQKFIFEKRGYVSVEDHDSKLITTLNDHVRKNDILFHLGDFCLNTKRERVDDILNQLTCENIYYIWGNHNAGMKDIYRETVNDQFDVDDDTFIYPLTYKNKLTFLGPYKEISINKKFIVISHYPFEIWNQQQNNVWHLCGHSHHGNPTTLPTHKNGYCLDVGWDGYARPISYDEIADIMNNKQYYKKDLHH